MMDSLDRLSVAELHRSMTEWEELENLCCEEDADIDKIIRRYVFLMARTKVREMIASEERMDAKEQS